MGILTGWVAVRVLYNGFGGFHNLINVFVPPIGVGLCWVSYGCGICVVLRWPGGGVCCAGLVFCCMYSLCSCAVSVVFLVLMCVWVWGCLYLVIGAGIYLGKWVGCRWLWGYSKLHWVPAVVCGFCSTFTLGVSFSTTFRCFCLWVSGLRCRVYTGGYMRLQVCAGSVLVKCSGCVVRVGG